MRKKRDHAGKAYIKIKSFEVSISQEVMRIVSQDGTTHVGSTRRYYMTWGAFFIGRIGDQAGEIPSNQSYAESPLIENVQRKLGDSCKAKHKRTRRPANLSKSAWWVDWLPSGLGAMSLSKYSGPRAKEMLVLSSGERSAPRRKGLIGRTVLLTMRHEHKIPGVWCFLQYHWVSVLFPDNTASNDIH